MKKDYVETYIPINPSSYRINEELYSYNKDSDQWFCIAGNETYKKKNSTVQKRGKDYKILKYYFEKEKCRNCPYRDKCIGKGKSIGKIFEISANAPEYYEYSQREKQPEFYEKYKKRAPIEGKNAEMKRFHGLARARGYGLKSVALQTKFTAIAVNLKRIAKLLSSSKNGILQNLQVLIINFIIFLLLNLENRHKQFKIGTFSAISNRTPCPHMLLRSFAKSFLSLYATYFKVFLI